MRSLVARADRFFRGMSAEAHHRFLWFWVLNMPPTVILFFVLGAETFIKWSLLYTVLASQWACVGTHAGGEDAALAKIAAEGNAG